MARSGVVAARTFLEDQLEKRKEDIRSIEREWEQFAHSNAVVTDGLDGQNVAREYAGLQTKRDALSFQLEQEKQTLTILKDQLEEAQPSLRSTVLEEQKVQSLRTQIQALENQIAELKAQAEQYYINDPSLRGNESRVRELADMKRRIDGFEARKVELTEELVEASRAAGSMAGSAPQEEGGGGAASSSIGQLGTLRSRIRQQEMTISQLEAQIRALNGRIESYEGRLSSIPRQTIQREQLDRRLAQAEQFYKDIAMELQQTIVAEESELGYVKIMRSAVVPVFPVSPNPKQNVLLGLLLGLGLGVGLAFVRQSMNWQIYEPDDIQTRGYSLVGVIPDMQREIKKAFKGDNQIEVEGRMLSTSLFPLLNPWSPITENYRLIRANLQFASTRNGKETSHPSQLMMITSPEPGDGKTTTALNLAITIALSGRKVLLIDADMRRANVHKLLGVERGPGLADVLSGERTADVVQDTLVDGLSLLAAGVPSVPPTELLDTERMRALLDSAADRYDAVIMDTPPVLAATDPIVLAPYCDAILVVASADKTDFRALSQVESTLGAVGVPIGGVIFNRYDAEKASGGYKYGYGYDYKYDYSPTST
jgi:capsular exopolysaccharide synthesis family protein